jgi:nucleoside-diphosphate-sugar epimerase
MGVKRNLVLGGSGLVGKGLCAHLESIGEEVINIDIKNGSQFDLRVMDLMPYAGVDFVWFLAWDVGGAKYLTQSKNLLNILKNNTLLCERVFGFLEETALPFMFATTQLADPNNTYGITKLLGEEWTRLLGGKTARFWNVYGWEEPGERSHVIPDLVIQAITQKRISLMTTGEEERQFIYMEDCATNLVLIRDSMETEVDLTNGEWVKIKDLAAIVAQKLDAELVLGDVKGYNKKLDPTKTPAFLNNKINLDEGLGKIIEQAKEYVLQQTSV